VTANPRLLVGLAALQFTLFPIPIITLFWKDQIGLSLADIFVLQAVFGLAVVVLEFPSGYVADRMGYRRSLLVGAALLSAGWLIYTAATSFAGVIVAEVVLGGGSAFISGADRALLWVSLEADGRQSQYTRWDGRVRAAAQVGEAGSAAIGGWLYTLAPRLPFWLQVPVSLFAAAIMGALHEAPRRGGPSAHRSHLERALHVVRFTLWHHRRLQTAMALSVALGLSTFVVIWLIQPAAQARGVPPAWFGPLWAGAHAWLAVVSLASARVVGAVGPRIALFGCCLLVALGYAGLAAIASPWGLGFYLCFMTIRGLQAPILTRLMQEHAPGEDRASVLSLAALLFRLAFVVVGPPVGLLVDRAGMRAALGVLAVVFSAMALTAFRAFTRAHRDPRTLDGDALHRRGA
jgi:MFS family permease